MKKYNGVCGIFEYDEEQYEVLEPLGQLHYIGDGTNVVVPDGMISMDSLFAYFEGEQLDIQHIDSRNCTDFNSMFSYCENLKNINGLDKFNTGEGKVFDCMFVGCKNLEAVDVAEWDMHNAISIGGMFSECKNLKKIEVSKWNVENCIDMEQFANGCYSLFELHVENWNTVSLQNFSKFVCSCFNLRKADISKWDNRRISQLDGALANCPNLQNPDLSSWTISDYTISRMYLVYKDAEPMSLF